MPNWVRNRVRAKNREDAQKLIDILVKEVDGKKYTNFNGIIPMPEELRNSTAGSGNPEWEKEHKRNKEKYGYRHWYDFAVAEWGTKWDNLEVAIRDGVIVFESAWSMPGPIYMKIAETIPIVVEYADEDIGCNFGICKYDNEGWCDINVDGTDIQIANAIWGYYSEEADDGEGSNYSDAVQKAVDKIMDYNED